MKKFLALLAALSLLTFAGNAFAVTINATPASVFAIVGVNAPTATVTGTAANPNGTLTYAKTGGPDWATLKGNTITFTPGSTVADGPYTVTITVTETYTVSVDVDDPSASGHAQAEPRVETRTETANATVTATVYTIKPITLTASPATVQVTAGTTTGSATLASAPANGGSAVTYTLVSAPSWASLSGNTVTFAPGADVNADTYIVKARATEIYTLADGIQRTATRDVTINVNVAAYVVPVTPVTSKDKEDTGNEAAKETEVAVATETKTVTKTVVTTTTETKTVTVQTFSDTAVAAQKIVTTVTKEETTQTVTQATQSLRVSTTTAATNAANDVVETLIQTTTSTTTTTSTATEVATQLLVAVNATNTSSTPAEENTSAAASKQSMVTSLLKGNTASAGSDAVDTSFLTGKAKPKADGSQETLAETLLRVLDETIATATRVLTASNPTTSAKLVSMFTSTATSTTTTTSVTVVDSTTLVNSSVTQADGSESDEAPEFTDVMAMLAQQAQQEVEDTEEETEARDKADATLAEVQQEVPVAVAAPVSLPDDAEPAIGMINMPTQKPDMYGKPIRGRSLKQSKGSKFQTVAFTTAAIDADEDGSMTFLNSIGQPIEKVPGEGEWGTPDGETDEQLIIPGQVTVAMLMQPGVVYTPVITTPAEELNDVEGVSTQEETTEVSVDVTTVEEVTVSVAVYDQDTFSTNFDPNTEAYFEAQRYDVHVGEFIVSGDAGVFSVTSDAETNMLADTKRAVVRTIPKIAPKGNTASPVAQYVMKVRYDIPIDSDTMKISSADQVLAFWPKGLVNAAGETETPGEADFLHVSGDQIVKLTGKTIREVAAGNKGDVLDENTRSYEGYIAMTLLKLDDNDEPYTPVITVKREAVTASETPGGETPGGETPGGETPGGETPGGETPGGNTPGTTSVGSSGGSCDAGFGTLALAVLAGFIAARKK